MKRALPLLLASLAAAPVVRAQDPPQDPPEQDDKPRLEIAMLTDRDMLLRTVKGIHGGETLDQLEMLRFELAVSSFDEEGKELPAAKPILFEIYYAKDRQVVRITENRTDENGKTNELVTLCSRNEGSVWIDGQANDAPDHLEGALLESRSMLALLDLLLRPDSPELRLRIEGQKKRNGIDYLAVHFEFHQARRVFEQYRTFYNPQTYLVDRIDAFNVRSLRRIRTTDISGYEDHDGIKVPTRFVIKDVKGKPVGAWTLSGVALDPEIPMSRFSGY